MNYSATKIALSCDESAVRAWVACMRGHPDEVAESFEQEGVRHEVWFMGRDSGALFQIGVMDVDDQPASAVIAARSPLAVDEMHRRFKSHWDRSRIVCVAIDPEYPPMFPDCECLFDARPPARG